MPDRGKELHKKGREFGIFNKSTVLNSTSMVTVSRGWRGRQGVVPQSKCGYDSKGSEKPLSREVA